MARTKLKVSYAGSVFWLIFWLIVFFPVGIVLFVTAMDYDFGGNHYSIRYDGSRFWLGFWTLVFFPIAILLGVLKGLSIDVDRALSGPGTLQPA